MKIFLNANEDLMEAVFMKIEKKGDYDEWAENLGEWIEINENQGNKIATSVISASNDSVRIDYIEEEIKFDGELWEQYGYELLYHSEFKVFTIRGYSSDFDFDRKNWETTDDEDALLYDNEDAAKLALNCLEAAIGTWKIERLAEIKKQEEEDAIQKEIWEAEAAGAEATRREREEYDVH